MRKLCLKKNEDRRLRAGHLWIFANEVDVKQSPLTDFAPGESATLCDWRGAPLGSVCVNMALVAFATAAAGVTDGPVGPGDAHFPDERIESRFPNLRMVEKPVGREIH